MSTEAPTCSAVHPQAAAAVWRIFGSGASPLKARSSYDLVEPVVRKYVTASRGEQEQVIAEIRGWFESHGDKRWIGREAIEVVAGHILEGIGSDRSETAVWAIASIDADRAARIIREHWQTVEEVDSFVEAAIDVLEKLCARDEVLDAKRVHPMLDGIQQAKVPRDAVTKEGRLHTVRHLHEHGYELVRYALHPPAASLIELVVELRPSRFTSVVARLDHPVLQVRAADRMAGKARREDHRATTSWITDEASEALIALAIDGTLTTVNLLGQDLHMADRAEASQYGWSTELCPPNDDLDAAAACLLTTLAEALGGLEPKRAARWIGELLAEAPHGLTKLDGDTEVSRRAEQLEQACTTQLVHIAQESWSDGLLDAMRDGLGLSPRTTSSRHLAELAWALRDIEPECAMSIARTILEGHEEHVAEERRQGHLFLRWGDWHHRQWLSGLGIAVALGEPNADLVEWTLARCRSLPLTIWDAEENHSTFATACRAVEHWFLVGSLAVIAAHELGRAIEPTKLLVLAEALWDHGRFAGPLLHEHPENSVAAEYVARVVAEFTAPSDVWLLERARDPRVGPRALWALLDQRLPKDGRERGVDASYDEVLTRELVEAASPRFGDGTQFGREALHMWGRLWIDLGAIEESERTAKALLALDLRQNDRRSKILALRLLAQAATAQSFDGALADVVVTLYRELWGGGYSPSDEVQERERIDELLEQADIRFLRPRR